MADCPDCKKKYDFPEYNKSVLTKYADSLKGKETVKCDGCGLTVEKEKDSCPGCGSTEGN